MHKSDYLAQVEALRASPELRARVAGLAGTPARRRRLRPWMGEPCCCPGWGAAPPAEAATPGGASSSPTPDRSFP